MSGAFKILTIADESAEFPAALTYAALTARARGADLAILRVVEPSAPAEWVSVSEEIRRQAGEAAGAMSQRFAAEVWAETGITAQIIVREGELKGEIKRLIEEDAAIKLVVLGIGAGQTGPGPLVSGLARGHALAGRPVAVLLAPGGLSKSEVRALALADPEAG